MTAGSHAGDMPAAFVDKSTESFGLRPEDLGSGLLVSHPSENLVRRYSPGWPGPGAAIPSG